MEGSISSSLTWLLAEFISPLGCWPEASCGSLPRGPLLRASPFKQAHERAKRSASKEEYQQEGHHNFIMQSQTGDIPLLLPYFILQKEISKPIPHSKEQGVTQACEYQEAGLIGGASRKSVTQSSDPGTVECFSC